jgi:hypothetical protein
MNMKKYYSILFNTIQIIFFDVNSYAKTMAKNRRRLFFMTLENSLKNFKNKNKT